MEPTTFRLISTLFAAFFLLLLSISFFHHPPTSPPPSKNILQNAGVDVGAGGCSHDSDVPNHPLDPLTVQEINAARSILRSHPPFSSSPDSIVVHSLVLDEPDKDAVLAWTAGDPLPPRRAAAIVRFRGEAHHLSFSLSGAGDTAAAVTALPVPATGYPTMTVEEMNGAATAPLSDSRFNATVLARGVRLSDVACLPLSSGWFGSPEQGPRRRRRRVIKVQCYSAEGTPNFYMRPIEGLTVLLDLDTMKVVEVSDVGAGIPIPTASGTDYRHRDTAAAAPPAREPSFEVVGRHLVRWEGWEFHLKPDPRSGVVVSAARVSEPTSPSPEKKMKKREVMYKGFASELFVPYMDPSEAWYFKTYLDAGEYGFGLNAMPLVKLNDCPSGARYMDAVFAAGNGRPYVRRDMVCVFESYSGDIAWRHSESPITGMEIRESRAKVTLVVRMAASVANYDYIIDWEFQADGLIRIKVGLSGILMVKGTPYTKTSEVPEGEDTHGTLISENLIGVIHDHYITFHLDLDVDGAANSFVKVEMSRKETSTASGDPSSPPPSPRRSYLSAERRVARTEKEGRVRLGLYGRPAELHVVNPGRSTRVGNPTGYKLVPGGTAANLLEPSDDPSQRRGAFTNNQVWITPYNRSEMFAGGLFPYQGEGDDTLAVWSERDLEIENRDIVVWYTMGFHHIPCQEDFPLMPTVSSSFDLKPVNFFERNPVIAAAPFSDEQLPVCRAAA